MLIVRDLDSHTIGTKKISFQDVQYGLSVLQVYIRIVVSVYPSSSTTTRFIVQLTNDTLILIGFRNSNRQHGAEYRF